MAQIPTLPPKVDVRTRTRTKTKVTVALLAGLVLAAAAASIGTLQLRQQITQPSLEAVPRTAQQVQVAHIPARVGDLDTLRLTFVPTTDVTPQTQMNISLPSGVNASHAIASISTNVDGSFDVDALSRVVEISRVQGRSTVAAGSASIVITLRNVIVPDGTPVQQTQLALIQPTSPPADPDEVDPPTETGPEIDPIDAEEETESVEGLTGLRLDQPDGSDVLTSGQTYDIKWSWEGTRGSEIRLSYSPDGRRYYTIEEAVPAAMNSYAWTVPERLETRNARVRLQGISVDGIEMSSESTNPIIILLEEVEEDEDVVVVEEEGDDDVTVIDANREEHLRLIYPNGGEVLNAGSTMNIKWEYEGGYIERVNLYYTLDGRRFTVLASNLGVFDGTYAWQIPEDADTQYGHIRIVGRIGESDRIAEDYSDDHFSVEPASESSEEGDTTETAEEADDDDDDDGSSRTRANADQPTVVSGGGGVGSGYGGSSRGSSSRFTTSTSDLGEGRLIKLQCPAVITDVNHPCRAVYYLTNDGIRHAFPNSKVYFSWFDNFNNIHEVSAAEIQTYRVGPNTTYKPGYTMVKFQTLNTVYAVTQGGVLRGVASESVARDLYGPLWNQHVHDIPDTFFNNYDFGAPIVDAGQYDPASERASLDGIWQNY